jgi:GT2 family glycosyltransferase
MLDLSIVIINYKTRDLTSECIKSVLKHTKKIKYEIILIDNDSQDDSVESIKKILGSQHTIISNKQNLGFAAANNQGLKVAKGKYILFLNSDTLILDNSLDKMIDWMDKNPDVAVSTCKLLNADKSIQPTGGFFPTPFRLISWMLFVDDMPILNKLTKPFHPHKDFYLRKQNLDWVTGAFLLARTEVIKEVNGFSQDYFMYTEEVDLCYQIKKLGWQVWYLPSSAIIHYGQASGSSEKAIVSEFKGIKIFYQKNYGKLAYSSIRIFLYIGAIIRILIFSPKTYAKALREI